MQGKTVQARLYKRLLELAEKRGLRIKQKAVWKPIRDKLHGFYLNNQRLIVVNRHLSQAQKNFTLAHELGHYSLHRDTAALARRFKTYKEFLGEGEKEADRFAEKLLTLVTRGLAAEKRQASISKSARAT